MPALGTATTGGTGETPRGTGETPRGTGDARLGTLAAAGRLVLRATVADGFAALVCRGVVALCAAAERFVAVGVGGRERLSFRAPFDAVCCTNDSSCDTPPAALAERVDFLPAVGVAPDLCGAAEVALFVADALAATTA